MSNSSAFAVAIRNSTSSARAMNPRGGIRVPVFFSTVIGLLAASIVAGISWGSTRMDWETVLTVLGAHLLPRGWVDTTHLQRADDLIVWAVRTPRVVLAVLVGAGLSCAGVQMQAIFRNPLAEPGFVGVGAGSALGAILALTTGAATWAALMIPFCAFSGGLLAMLLVYAMATQGGRTPSGALLLTGVAVGAVLGSFSTFIISVNLANQQMTQQIMFWTMGGLDARTWLHVQICWPFIAAGLIMAIYFSRDLDLLLQGEETAASLGMKVELTKRFVIVGASLLTGASVGVAGMVGFVGLIIPHAVRLILGPSHRRLLPASILAGAVFVILCDLLARTVRAPQEINLGVMTALWGGPFFLVLLYRRMKEGGLW